MAAANRHSLNALLRRALIEGCDTLERARAFFRDHSHGWREEFAATGFDDRYQNIGADLQGTLVGPGLRIPSAVVGDPYVFVLAAADLLPGDRVVALGQYLEIAQQVATGGGEGPHPPFYPLFRDVRNATWCFVDSFYYFVLTFENVAQVKQASGPFDQESFIFEDSLTPACVYETAGFPGKPAFPGYLGLNVYGAPALRGTPVLSLRELRYPYQDESKQPIHYIARVPTRVRFYGIVKQTSITRTKIIIDPTSPYLDGLLEEDLFIQLNTNAIWHRIGGRMVIERNAGAWRK